MVGSASAGKKAGKEIWVKIGTDKSLGIRAAQKVNRMKEAVGIMIGAEIDHRLMESTRGDLDGEHLQTDTIEATLVDTTVVPEPEDGQLRYYGVVYYKQIPGEEWKWRWTQPVKNLKDLTKNHAKAMTMVGDLVGMMGAQVRICKTTRTDMEGWQVAGKPEDGEWVETPEPVKTKFIYPVCREGGQWWWGTAYPRELFESKSLTPGELRDEFNRMMKLEGNASIQLYASDRGDLTGEHPTGETFGATLIE